mmetsp:Transcript_5944/g.24885  ORF Transcript_5944/g.24885 Transcript_5944/m.24885 type:complete len:202 (+) Transcript_5944:1759-2364(+)
MATFTPRSSTTGSASLPGTTKTARWASRFAKTSVGSRGSRVCARAASASRVMLASLWRLRSGVLPRLLLRVSTTPRNRWPRTPPTVVHRHRTPPTAARRAHPSAWRRFFRGTRETTRNAPRAARRAGASESGPPQQRDSPMTSWMTLVARESNGRGPRSTSRRPRGSRVRGRDSAASSLTSVGIGSLPSSRVAAPWRVARH